MTKKTIRIGNAGGYWGDDPQALKRQVDGGNLDYITMDFLAEITMSILQKQISRDPNLGYAKDFLAMLEGVLPDILKNKTKIITNAGGICPQNCAIAIEKLGNKLGVKPKVAIVYGDDILPDLPTLKTKGESFKNMENGQNFSDVEDKIKSANIYFGANSVIEALKWDPDIIVTGRVTDTGITIAPMIHELNWQLNDWDRLASGIVAGHILECGTQATGGNFTDWEKIDSFDNVGFPIVEVSEDGSFVVTKHDGSGGKVSLNTVREQLFYEMGNPKNYITPDVVCDFSSIQAEDLGNDQVKIFGVKGFEPTPLYKVSMAYEDGYKSVGTIAICGPHARKKAEKFSEIFWNRAGSDFEEMSTEYFGYNACHRSLVNKEDGNEIILRLSARSLDKKKLAIFGKLVPSLILSGPPGVSVLGGVPKAQEVMSYWPALMDKKKILPKIALYQAGSIVCEETIKDPIIGNHEEVFDSFVQKASSPSQKVTEVLKSINIEGNLPLSSICLGRSGDKGDMANIGIMARSEESYQFLKKYLTAQLVKDLFQELCFGEVIRYELDNLKGLNFLLEQSLGGGGTKTLRTDAQGKTFAQALIAQKAPIPENILNK